MKTTELEYPLSAGINFVISSPKGKFAHENFSESKYAVDFLVEIGTPVVSVKDGVVYKAKSDSDKWGVDIDLSQDVNFVAVDHGDGTYAEYVHLGQGRVEVEVCQRVRKGDLLGYTGMSGMMDKPHLHFNLFKIEKGKGVSLPIVWKKRKTSRATLQNKHKYE